MLPVLHVGFHKCGSTTLQGALFARHPQIACLGEPTEDPTAFEAMRGIWRSCEANPKKRIDFDLERCRGLWQEALANIAPDKVPVFSKELLTQSEHYVGPEDDRIPKRLRAVVGPAKIVIIVRHQIRLVESLYLFHAKGARYEAAEPWLDARSNDLQLYRYHAMVNSFVEQFGRENVAVFMFEELKADAGAFARRLCDFMNVDAEQGAVLIRGERRNRRVSQRYLAYSKLRKALGMYVDFGRVVPEPVKQAVRNFLAAGAEAKAQLPGSWVAKMEQYFRDDNRRLAQDWGLPLGKYGYPL